MLDSAKILQFKSIYGKTPALSVDSAWLPCGTIDRSRVALRTKCTTTNRKQKAPAFLRGLFVLLSVLDVQSAVGNKVSSQLKTTTTNQQKRR